MKTVNTTNTIMPYKPEPTPPKTTSPSCMSISGIRPPSAVNESCIALTAPHDVSVVITAKSVEAAMPKRVSLPSKLPPFTPSAWISGLPAASAAYAPTKPATKSVLIAAKSTQP